MLPRVLPGTARGARVVNAQLCMARELARSKALREDLAARAAMGYTIPNTFLLGSNLFWSVREGCGVGLDEPLRPNAHT